MSEISNNEQVEALRYNSSKENSQVEAGDEQSIEEIADFIMASVPTISNPQLKSMLTEISNTLVQQKGMLARGGNAEETFPEDPGLAGGGLGGEVPVPPGPVGPGGPPVPPQF